MANISQKYDAVIQDQVQKGIVEVVPDEDCTKTLKTLHSASRGTDTREDNNKT